MTREPKLPRRLQGATADRAGSPAPLTRWIGWRLGLPGSAHIGWLGRLPGPLRLRSTESMWTTRAMHSSLAVEASRSPDDPLATIPVVDMGARNGYG